jgi:hypothetical protein
MSRKRFTGDPKVRVAGFSFPAFLECGGPPPLLTSSMCSVATESTRGLVQSKTWRIALLFCF